MLREKQFFKFWKEKITECSGFPEPLGMKEYYPLNEFKMTEKEREKTIKNIMKYNRGLLRKIKKREILNKIKSFLKRIIRGDN